MFSYELSCEPLNLLPQNRYFVRGLRQFSSHLTKCNACHGICTLSPLDAALTMRFAKTRNTTRLKCCACHAKWWWAPPKCCASETVAKVLCLPHKTTFDTLPNTSECHEVPRLPRETKQRDAWNLQKWPLLQNLPKARPYGPHANGCGRLRTVADGWATSSEHTLNPQTPRVKREPLLRILQKQHWHGSHWEFMYIY